MTSHSRRSIISLALSALVLLFGLVEPSHARIGDDAVVLPKGYYRMFFDAEFFIPFNQRFNRNGDPEPLGADFNRNLNSSVFPALSAFGAGATLGQSVVSYQRNLQQYLFQPAYGLTDRLTIGANIPYVWVRNDIGAGLNTSGANINKDPALVSGANPLGLCRVGVTCGGGATPLNANDVQTLLVGQGFKPVQSWQREGFGDLELGARYQYYRADNFRAAFTGGVRFPTGYKDDPDNLVDTAWGTGAYALLFRFNQDLMFQKEGLGKRLGFPDPWTGFINTTISYDLNLPDKQLLRVCSPRAPVCSSKDSVNRDLGDKLQAEISGKVGLFFPGLIFSPVYVYGHKFKDAYSGNLNLPYGDIAIDSEQVEHIYILSLTYTTIPAFVQKHFPFPSFATISYRDRFAGSNVVKSQYIGFTVAAFF